MKKTFNKLTSVVSYAMALSVLWVSSAHADFGPFEESFGKVLKKVFTFIFGAAGVMFVILFLVGGVQYLTSAGNEETSTKAKKLLLDAVIGLVIVVVSYAAATWIIKGIGGTIDPELR